MNKNKRDYEERQMSKKKVWGYSLGTMGEYMTYFVFTAFFTFYLTDYVNLSPAIASGIMSFGLFFGAVCDPIVGYINDRSRNPKGRRRPLMVKAYLPFVFAFALCYVRPDLEGSILIAYYCVVIMTLWFSYSCLQIPFYGMMPEVTHNSTDRMRIQMGVGVVGNASNIFVSIQPILFSFLIGVGVNEMAAWTITMGFFGLLGGSAYMSTWRTTKGMEKPIDKVERPKGNMFVTYGKILKLKGYIPAVLIYFFCTVFINLCLYSLVYVGEGKLHLSSLNLSIVIACYTFSGLFLTPLIPYMNKRFGAKNALLVALVPVIILNIIFGITGIHNMGMMMIHGFFTSATFVLATAFNYGLFYQIADMSLLQYDEELEGSMFSFATFGYKIGGAISATLLGIFLTLINYESVETVSPEAMARIDVLLTVFPAVMLIVCVLLVVFLYPMNEDLYRQVKEERHKKETGEVYSRGILEEVEYKKHLRRITKRNSVKTY